MKTVDGMDVVRTETVTALCPRILDEVVDLWRRAPQLCGPDCRHCHGKHWVDDVKLELGPKRKSSHNDKAWTAEARLTYPKLPLIWSAKAYTLRVSMIAGKRVRIPYKPRGTWGTQWHMEVSRDGVRYASERAGSYSWGVKRLLDVSGVIDWQCKGLDRLCSRGFQR